jgi:hypothetical protein
MGFVCLSEFSKRRCCCACWVSANPLCRLAMTSLPSAPTLRSPHRRRAANNSLRHTAILSQALAPLQSLAHVTPRHSIVSRQQMPRAPSRVSSPSAFSQPQRATQRHRPVNAGPEDSHLFGPLRPRVSHPLDAFLPSRPAGLVSSQSRSWGFPFEAFILPIRRTPSRAPRPSGLHRLPYRLRHRLPSRDSHVSGSPAPGPGLTRLLARMPPWVSPLRGFLPLAAAVGLAPRSPLALCRPRWCRRTGPVVGASGFSPAQGATYLSQDRPNPLAVLHRPGETVRWRLHSWASKAEPR